MTSRIYRPEQKHPQPYQDDLNPDASKGINWGLVGPHPEKHSPRTAKDIKELHRELSDLQDDQLSRIPVLPAGSRLETNATYINLSQPSIGEFTAKGEEEVSEQDWIVPKSEVDYELWNLLAGKGDHSLKEDVMPKTKSMTGKDGKRKLQSDHGRGKHNTGGESQKDRVVPRGSGGRTGSSKKGG
jgi:hypothetical protein